MGALWRAPCVSMCRTVGIMYSTGEWNAGKSFLRMVERTFSRTAGLVLPSRFGIRIHGYVLMGNHYHLQLQTPQANLSRAMQWLNLSYGAWFNRRWQRSGPLVHGRFKAILHEPENTALIINRYIHLNPVRVRALGGHEARSGAEGQLEVSGTGPSRELVKARVEALSSYRWSSYPAYVGRVRNPGWLTTESIYRFFGEHTLHSLRGAYRRQLEEMAELGQLETDWRASIKATVLLGSREFIQKMLGMLTRVSQFLTIRYFVSC